MRLGDIDWTDVDPHEDQFLDKPAYHMTMLGSIIEFSRPPLIASVANCILFQDVRRIMCTSTYNTTFSVLRDPGYKLTVMPLARRRP